MRTKTGNGHNVNVEQFIEDLKVVVRDGEELLKASFGGLKQRAIAGAKTSDKVVRGHPYQSLDLLHPFGTQSHRKFVFDFVIQEIILQLGDFRSAKEIYEGHES